MVRDTISLTADQAAELGLEAAERATHPATLVAHGYLAMDPLRVARVDPRFAGEVVAYGTVASPSGEPRPLRSGDPVRKGDLLAVVWSSDLSEEKNDLLNVLSALRLERDSFAKVEALHKAGAVADQSYREARRELEDAEIDAARAERSLRARGVTEEEVERVEREAEVLRERRTRSEYDPERSWGRFSIRSPIDGTLIESRFSVGEVVETDDSMFVVGDLGRLVARVQVHERDLADVEALPTPISWTILPLGRREDEPIAGTVETIGAVIDPETHATTLSGLVDNPRGRLHPGQRITARIEMPADPSLVEVPRSAMLIGGEGEAFVFVQPRANRPVFRLRRVEVARISDEHLVTRAERVGGLVPGERVVVRGAARLKVVLDGADWADGAEDAP
jgi:cobalt-zinc-cadmium efflux system membrane fusion protein